MVPSRSSRPELFLEMFLKKKDVLRNFTKFTGKHLKPEACNFIKKETMAQKHKKHPKIWEKLSQQMAEESRVKTERN